LKIYYKWSICIADSKWRRGSITRSRCLFVFCALQNRKMNYD